MAKGNIGNLLQHFIGLSCANRLVDISEGKPLEYIDCYSMAPWEMIDGKSQPAFDKTVQQFAGKAAKGDFIARSFLSAWKCRYGSEDVPADPNNRDYPNTAVLLRTAFPQIAWNMRLHDIDSVKRKNLEEWARQQSPGTYSVAGKWIDSPLILKAPASQDAGVLVMLDPFRIVEDNHSKAEADGFLPQRLLRYLFGSLALNLHTRDDSAGPCAILLFSYSDDEPNVPDGVIRAIFPQDQWAIERVQTKPFNFRGANSYHQGWVVTKGSSQQSAPTTLQIAWDEWAG